MTTAPHRSPAAGLALAVAALAACGPAAKPEPALTLAELKSADLQTEYVSAGVVRLTDGEYREPAAPGAASTTVVTLTGPVAYAPLVSVQPAARRDRRHRDRRIGHVRRPRRRRPPRGPGAPARGHPPR